MKIVHFSSGLGNQVFFYLFCKYIQDKYPKERVYGYYNAKWLKKHNGLELNRVFDVSLPPHTWLSDSLAWLCRKLNGLGIKGLKATDSCFSEKSIYFDGYYQNKKFIERFVGNLRFRDFQLSEENKKIVFMIKNTQSVAIHVRRGDYLLPEFNKMFGGICTKDYYCQAVDYIKDKINNPIFFVFSDDIEWVKKNLGLEKAIYVTNNTGSDSFFDMYLMSLCKANIIANSTFSFWGAMLNQNKPLVVYPKIWNNFHTPDIFPINWIKL